jgi:phosphatidylethanolamine N-methyltransferase
MYTLPPDWFYGLTLLRHVLGVALVALQFWTATSIYESLGEFGWFCGDFFFDPPSSNLTYSGIYRFLNNPERVLGLAGIWGMALIAWNAPIFYYAAMAHILNLAFLQFVERPHMVK